MQQTEIGGKAIVFSQFVNMLDLLEYRITLGGIQCVKLLGSMSIDQRDKVSSSEVLSRRSSSRFVVGNKTF